MGAWGVAFSSSPMSKDKPKPKPKPKVNRLKELALEYSHTFGPQ